MSSLFTSLLIVNFFLLALLIAEFIYSYIKKDNVYTLPGTLGNVLSGVILIIVSTFFGRIYSQITTTIHTVFDYTYTPITVPTIILCIITVDFCYYLFHRLHHIIPFLWALHSVHHGDNTMNISTAYRISWFEHIYFLLFFTPALLVGFNPVVIVFSIYCLSMYQAFCHSSYLKFPRFIDYVLITPQTHAVHHSQDRNHQKNNFSGILTIWDHLFGTFHAPIKKVSLGIANYTENNCFKYQTEPLVRYLIKRSTKSK